MDFFSNLLILNFNFLKPEKTMEEVTRTVVTVKEEWLSSHKEDKDYQNPKFAIDRYIDQFPLKLNHLQDWV